MLGRGWMVLATVALAGCLGPSAPATLDDGDAAEAMRSGVPRERPLGASAHQLLYDFAMGHPFRHAARPVEHEAARAYLEATLESAGTRVMREAYSATGTNLLGFLDGATEPEAWIVLSCHYDILESTVYGARDDGLGCAALLELARTFATATWNRTLVFAFFDEEEQGLVGSRAFVRTHAADENRTLVANLNFDPPGLHWPCRDALGPYPVFLITTLSKVEGPEAVHGYAAVLDAARAGFLGAGVPEEFLEVHSRHAYLRLDGRDFLPPGSDDDAFDAADVPSLWMGVPNVDRVPVGDTWVWGYPNHTPPDTAALVEARCGSADLLRQGLQVSLDATLHAVRVLDQRT